MKVSSSRRFLYRVASSTLYLQPRFGCPLFLPKVPVPYCPVNEFRVSSFTSSQVHQGKCTEGFSWVTKADQLPFLHLFVYIAIYSHFFLYNLVPDCLFYPFWSYLNFCRNPSLWLVASFYFLQRTSMLPLHLLSHFGLPKNKLFFLWTS